MTDNAAEIARQLTTSEREALQDVDSGKQLDYPMWQALSDKGLIVVTHDQKYNRKDELTLGGRDVLAVLAALQPATEPAQAGGAAFAPSGEKLGVIEEMESTLISSVREPHEVKGLGMWWMHEGEKILMFESSVVADVQHELSLAKDKVDTLRAQLAAAESRLRQAEAALRFYADKSNYVETWSSKGDSSWINVVLDEGAKAAAALARESEE